MKKTKYIILSSLLAFTSLTASKISMPDILNPSISEQATPVHSTFKRTGPTVQIGILLDTSGSMSGLIDQAKDQLWKIVNEVAKANKHNKDVNIQVGLFEYGKSALPSYEGYLQMLSPLTYDLDKVSEELFQLRTNGGEEYAGKVILESVNRFAWSSHKDDMKLLIIAGNESFAQGSVPYKQAIEKAKHNGIIVNTIFCGTQRQGKNLHWEDAATRGEGKYFNINHNDRRVYIATPYDDDIIILGKRLNSTYVSYGERKVRRAKRENIEKQDANAFSYSKTSYVERNLVKSKKQYTQASSDMVSAYTKDKNSIMQMKESEMPDAFKGKSKEEISKIIEKKKQERSRLQKEIRKLESKRDSYIAKNTKKDSKDLGSAVIKSIRKQAKENGFNFKN
ncbi:MAG: VWA domain-containing protein [Epsilonproteobacteria bacterium]|nr:MAG: VWA domain-containing protein [Campylobacterota bacterium]